MDPTLALFLGLVGGVALCFLLIRGSISKAHAEASEQKQQRNQVEEQLTALQVDRAATESQLQAKLEASESSLEERSRQLADLNQQLEKLRSSYQEQMQKLSTQLGDQLGEKFRLHADASLKKQEEDFLKRAGASLKPLDESLKQLQQQTAKLEEARAGALGSVAQQLTDLSEVTVKLRSQSESLTTALRGSSKARGQWGETTLRNLVEIAGLVEYCDFLEQRAEGDDRKRPDMQVRLPGKEIIPIDAKVPLAAYMDAVSAKDLEERERFLLQHAQDVRLHVRTLGSKDYARDMEGGIDFTVLYLPGDHFLDAAFKHFPNLHEEALAKKVLIATPVTLLALLKTVQLVWRNESVSRDAQQIKDTGVELHNRVRKFAEYLDTLGKRLESTSKAYNQASRSFSTRLLPQGRKIAKLTVQSQESEQLKELAEVKTMPDLPTAGSDD